MIVKHVKVKMGMTQNLGDYTNCRPEIEFEAEISQHDNLPLVVDRLSLMAVEKLHQIIDDELEQRGRVAMYHEGDFYHVYCNDSRKCIVVVEEYETLPIDSNWKEKDVWQYVGYDWPGKMRFETAMKAVEHLESKHPDYRIVDYLEFASELPPLPDPGPEPIWYQKDLKSAFERLGIKKEEWENLAEYEHVDKEYLEGLAKKTYYNSVSARIDIIKNAVYLDDIEAYLDEEEE